MTERERLGTALLGVPAATRTALEMAVVNGLGYREIAQRLGESEEHIAGLLREGLLQLRAHVGGQRVAV